MKQLKITSFIAGIVLLYACSKEKQIEKMLYGEWEVTSFLHGDDDLTQFYKDSCGCRLVFAEYIQYDYKYKTCILKCSFNSWNYYYTDSLVNFPWRNHQFEQTSFEISETKKEISWLFGKSQPHQIYRWGMYPLTISCSPDECSSNMFNVIDDISEQKFSMKFMDTTNIPYYITLKKR